MDNITHSLLAVALAHTGLNRGLEVVSRGPGGCFERDHDSTSPPDTTSAATTLLIAASNLPDMDVTSITAPLVFLEHHRGYTHTCWGVILLALLLPLPFLRWNQAIRRSPAESRKKYGYLFALSLLGTGSHLLLDFCNAYGARPMRPFSQHWVYGDFIAIVDPWIYLILGSVTFLITSRGKWRLCLWIAGIAMISLAVLSYGRHSVPDPLKVVRIVWCVSVAAVLLLRGLASRQLKPWSRSLAVVCLVTLSAYYLLCWQLHRVALDQLSAGSEAQVCSNCPSKQVAAAAVSGNPFLWTFVVDLADRYHAGVFDIRAGGVFSSRIVFKNLNDLPFDRAMQTCSGKVILRFARFPFLERWPDSEGWTVALRDLRFGALRGRAGFGSVLIRFDKKWRERPDTRPICPWSEAF
ncbi:MAG: metal-dependent hydrolase [Acidobacteria bacterium]|nr:metal-dependent hydrolase [Acidobacteriota bacterium]